MKRFQTRMISLVALGLLAGCGGGPDASPEEKAAGEKAKTDAAAAQVEGKTPYAAISAGKVDIEGGLVDIAARAPGIVVDVLVQEGDTVRKGQILARQESDDARLQRDRAQAQLRQAEAQVPVIEVQLAAAIREAARLERLISEAAVSRQALDNANDAVKQARAQLDAQRAAVQLSRAALNEANYQVELHEVRAPADGVIVRRYANPGMGASTLQVTPLFQLQPDMPRIVRAEVEERSLSLVSVGQKVEIVPESDQEKTYPGVVLRMAGVMGARKLRSDDPSERADERVVEVVVDAGKAPVLVGQRVFVKFLKPEGAQASAPASALPAAAAGPVAEGVSSN